MSQSDDDWRAAYVAEHDTLAAYPRLKQPPGWRAMLGKDRTN